MKTDRPVPGKIPSGITFGNKVVKIPTISPSFRESLRNYPYPKLVNLTTEFTWINRGDHFATYSILTPKYNNPFFNFFAQPQENEIYLKSPVSGLIIFSLYNFSSHRGDEMSILLPDDEHPAENGEYMFSDLCDFCWDNRENISPAEDPRHSLWKKGLKDQRSRSCDYVDALPNYDGPFREARTRHTQLRPFLRQFFNSK